MFIIVCYYTVNRNADISFNTDIYILINKVHVVFLDIKEIIRFYKSYLFYNIHNLILVKIYNSPVFPKITNVKLTFYFMIVII